MTQSQTDPAAARTLDLTQLVIVAGQSLEGVLVQVAHELRAAIVGHCEVGIVVLDGRGPVATVATSDYVRELDKQQLQRGAGPVHEALDDGRTHAQALPAASVKDCSKAHARDCQSAAVVAAPLVISQRVFGVVSFYADHADLAETFVERIKAIVQLATAEVFKAVSYSLLERRAVNLEHALDTRSTIECAKGILMERHHSTAAQAFEKLREQSQTTHVSLAVLASQILASHEGAGQSAE